MKAPRPGTVIEPTQVGPITLEMLKRYAKASGDYNPIHTDEEAAKKAGLPGIIAHGMLIAGFLADRAYRYSKPWNAEWRLSSLQARFKAMTLLGDVVTISGTVRAGDEESFFLDLNATNPAGEVTTQAHIEISLRRS